MPMLYKLIVREGVAVRKEIYVENKENLIVGVCPEECAIYYTPALAMQPEELLNALNEALQTDVEKWSKKKNEVEVLQEHLLMAIKKHKEQLGKISS